MTTEKEWQEKYDAAMQRANKSSPGMGISTNQKDYREVQAIVAARDAENARVKAENEAWHQKNKPSVGSSPSSTANITSAVPPAPILPQYKPANITSRNFKIAPTDIIQFDDSSIEIALITDLLFEDIGATELANISRSDLIDGQDVIYAPIKNLPTIRREFNPNNIVSTSYGTDFFSRFAIDISLRGVQEPYFDDNGDLVIEIGTVEDSEEIQVQILTNGTIDLVENP